MDDHYSAETQAAGAANAPGGWGLAQVWNAGLENVVQRPLTARNNVWASELGKAPVDVWLKMRATPYTNPPNARSLRKFEAGNVYEWIVSLLLKRGGILKEAQRWSSFQYPGMVAVTGKADFIAGGKVDTQRWENEIAALEFPEVFVRVGRQVVQYLEQHYPNGLAEEPLEVKSLSDFMFNALERKQATSRIHRIQAYHYAKADGFPRVHLVYINRNDLRMMEHVIYRDSYVEDEYRAAVETISKYHQANERPPLEKAVVFDDDLGKFAKNFNVAYSGYLTMLYGLKDQKEFDDQHTPLVGRWNRVVGRVKAGKKMTEKNNAVIAEIQQAGFSLADVLAKAAEEPSEEDEA